MKITLRFLFFFILLSFTIGFYFKNYQNNEVLGEKIVGATVLFSVLFFLPLFLYFRWKHNKIKFYNLKKENFDKITNNFQKKKKQIKQIKVFRKES